MFIQDHTVIQATRAYISCAMSNFCGTEIEIWADFGQVGSTEKNKFWGRL